MGLKMFFLWLKPPLTALTDFFQFSTFLLYFLQGGDEAAWDRKPTMVVPFSLQEMVGLGIGMWCEAIVCTVLGMGVSGKDL